ncbi:hypothetical protein [Deinococcus hohokamensis]|uniref:Uncharacterized protein n=1 Tax=Deinococcus hohokamensis TaxID=309883 RepID=A0ABV9I9K6_9DEIO
MSPEQDHAETRVLPAWLYPAAFWLSLPVLLLSLVMPGAERLGVWFMMAVPALAALVVVLTNWSRDRRVSVGALIALIGLGLVVAVRNLIA